MGKVSVVVVDATGNKEQKVGLPDDIKIGVIMVKLVEKIKLPSVGPDGNPISYKFIHKVSGRQLLETQTLAEAGIKDGDVLRLQPEITAGAVCNKCFTELAEDLAFCPNCGNPLVTEQPPVSAPAPENQGFMVAPQPAPATAPKNIPDFILSIAGLFSGLLSIILGLVACGFSDGGYEMSNTYGGDAYTGIQNAAAQTANNVETLAGIVKFGVASLLIVLGIAISAYFGFKFFACIKKGDK